MNTIFHEYPCPLSFSITGITGHFDNRIRCKSWEEKKLPKITVIGTIGNKTYTNSGTKNLISLMCIDEVKLTPPTECIHLKKISRSLSYSSNFIFSNGKLHVNLQFESVSKHNDPIPIIIFQRNPRMIYKVEQLSGKIISGIQPNTVLIR